MDLDERARRKEWFHQRRRAGMAGEHAWGTEHHHWQGVGIVDADPSLDGDAAAITGVVPHAVAQSCECGEVRAALLSLDLGADEELLAGR